MRKNLAITAGILTIAATAHAMFSDDIVGAKVICSGSGITAVASRNRKTLIVLKDDKKTIYNVVNTSHPASDGDTFISYIGLNEGPGAKKAVLSFDDQGDTLQLDGRTIEVECNL